MLRETSYVKSTWPGVSMRFQDVVLSVRGPIVQAHGVGLDGNAPFALQIHVVQHPVSARGRHLAVGERPGEFSILSARVDLPWSIWAIMQKFLIFLLVIT